MLIEIDDAIIKEVQDYHREQGYEIPETPLELKNIIEGCVLDEYRSLID
jgi:hypothetical protein